MTSNYVCLTYELQVHTVVLFDIDIYCNMQFVHKYILYVCMLMFNDVAYIILSPQPLWYELCAL